jgi:hypothetical protein
MLTPLEEGVKGGVWFSLIDKVYADRTLRAAWQRVTANGGAAGVDHVTVTMYERNLDRVLLCRSKADAQRALTLLRTWTQDAGLTLHPDKTRVMDARLRGGFEFLGYHFERGRHWPRTKSVKQLRATLRTPTRRSTGQALAVIIADVNRTLRGWFEYFQHSPRHALRPHDEWVRRRLRSLLRKRRGRSSRGRTRGDHQRWPNAFFATHGLFSTDRGPCTHLSVRITVNH